MFLKVGEFRTKHVLVQPGGMQRIRCEFIRLIQGGENPQIVRSELGTTESLLLSS